MCKSTPDPAGDEFHKIKPVIAVPATDKVCKAERAVNTLPSFVNDE
jgi:hypothetical protein